MGLLINPSTYRISNDSVKVVHTDANTSTIVFPWLQAGSYQLIQLSYNYSIISDVVMSPDDTFDLSLDYNPSDGWNYLKIQAKKDIELSKATDVIFSFNVAVAGSKAVDCVGSIVFHRGSGYTLVTTTVTEGAVFAAGPTLKPQFSSSFVLIGGTDWYGENNPYKMTLPSMATGELNEYTLTEVDGEAKYMGVDGRSTTVRLNNAALTKHGFSLEYERNTLTCSIRHSDGFLLPIFRNREGERGGDYFTSMKLTKFSVSTEYSMKRATQYNTNDWTLLVTYKYQDDIIQFKRPLTIKGKTTITGGVY